MPIETIKQSVAFPEIGQVRKGSPKDANGQVGKDLKTRFRVVFYPGDQNEKSRQRFLELHEGSLEPETLTVVFPFADPMLCWDSWYEAYTAGRLVARADGKKFVRWVDTKTGQVKVSGGEPYTEFTPGMVVGSYFNRKQNREEPIKCKAVGRLKIVLPELGRIAYLTVMTTSIYDVVRITEQLNGLNFIASYLPKGRGVVGIPLVLSRRLTDVTWVQPDGSAKRVKTGLINLETDPNWVVDMLASMSDMALPAGIQGALLPAGGPVQLDIPDQDLDQADDQALDGGDEEPPEEGPFGDFIEGEARDSAEPPIDPGIRANTGVELRGENPFPPQPLDQAPSQPEPVSPSITAEKYLVDATGKARNLSREAAEAIAQLAGVRNGDYSAAAALLPYFAECKANRLTFTVSKNILESSGMDPEKALFKMRDLAQDPRPYAPETLIEKLTGWSLQYKQRKLSNAQRGLVAMLLEKCFGDDQARAKRKAVLLHLFEKDSLSEIAPEIVLAMLDTWLKPNKDSGGDYDPDPMAAREVRAVYEAALKAEGQLELKLETS